MNTEDLHGSRVEATTRAAKEIDRLRAVNRASPDPGLERRLVELRLEAAAEAPATPFVAPTWWSRGEEDPFPEVVDQPPEVQASELTAKVLRGAIAHHGCLMVRNLISAEHAERLCADIDETLAAFDRCLERGPGATEPPWFVPFDIPGDQNLAFGRGFSRQVAGAVNAADTPRTFFDLVEAFDDGGVLALLTEYLGGETCVSIDKCTVRRVPADSATGWHQDSYRFPRGAPVADVWVAFSECGVDAPGLEIVPKRVEEVVDVDPTAPVPWVIEPRRVEAIAGTTPMLSPAFEPGDAIIFDEMLLHRTGTFDGMTKPRYGADAWFFPKGAYFDGCTTPLAF